MVRMEHTRQSIVSGGRGARSWGWGEAQQGVELNHSHAPWVQQYTTKRADRDRCAQSVYVGHIYIHTQVHIGVYPNTSTHDKIPPTARTSLTPSSRWSEGNAARTRSRTRTDKKWSEGERPACCCSGHILTNYPRCPDALVLLPPSNLAHTPS